MLRFVKNFMDSLSIKEDYAILICLQNDIPLHKINIEQIEAALNDKKQLKKTVKQLKMNFNHKAQC